MKKRLSVFLLLAALLITGLFMFGTVSMAESASKSVTLYTTQNQEIRVLASGLSGYQKPAEIPHGMTYDKGLLSGTPTMKDPSHKTETYSVTFTASGASATWQFTVSSEGPSFTVNGTYQSAITPQSIAIPGAGTLADKTIPLKVNGLVAKTVPSKGIVEVTGTPTQEVSKNLVYQKIYVSDTAGINYPVTIYFDTPSTLSMTGYAGEVFRVTRPLNGDGAQFSAGATAELPKGLTDKIENGNLVIEGTPEEGSGVVVNYSRPVKYANDTIQETIHVAILIKDTDQVEPKFYKGVQDSYTYARASGIKSASVSSGSMPEGLTLAAADKGFTISGAPSVDGEFTLFIKLIDNAGTESRVKCKLNISKTVPTPIVTKNPAAVTVEAGGSASFSAEFKYAKEEYYWTVDVGGTTYDPAKLKEKYPSLTVAGAATATFSLSNIPMDLNGAKIVCFVYGLNNANVKATTDGNAILTVTEPKPVVPTISKQPTAQTVKSGEEAQKLSVTAAAAEGVTLKYQWYSNTKNETEGATAISGATAAEYTPKSNADPLYYFVEVWTEKDKQSSDKIKSEIVKVEFESADTTKVEDTTTAEDTTKTPETTTAAPETTTKAPDTTTKEKETTTKEKDTTTVETTTAETTEPEDSTTDEEPDETTEEPEDTTTEPISTETDVIDTTEPSTTGPEEPPIKKASKLSPLVVIIGVIVAVVVACAICVAVLVLKGGNKKGKAARRRKW